VGQPILDTLAHGETWSAKNVVRIVAASDGTEIAVEPPQWLPSGASADFERALLDANQFVEFIASSPFRINASNPIMVAQMRSGSSDWIKFGDNAISSYALELPSMALLVPSEQYRKDYVFAVPFQGTPAGSSLAFEPRTYMLVTRKPGTTLVMDGKPVIGVWESVGGWEAASIVIDSGTHSIMGSSPFGVLLHGVVDNHRSYSYPAGQHFKQISSIP